MDRVTSAHALCVTRRHSYDARPFGEPRRREESRRGTHECVRHGLLAGVGAVLRPGFRLQQFLKLRGGQGQ